MNFKDKIETVFKALYDENARFIVMNRLGLCNCMSDEDYIKNLFKTILGKNLNLSNPITFSEKLQWLKIYNRNPEYSIMVDKYLVKKYVADRIGCEYIIPTLGVWKKPEDIDFNILPEKFVLKCNHNSGKGMCICKDKSKLNLHKVKKALYEGITENYYLHYREWPYKDVARRIIAEKYMEDNNDNNITDLIDYKFFCFNGVPRLCQVFKNRRTNETIDFFDMNWKHMDFKGLEKPHKPFFKGKIERPKNLGLMIQICSKLSEDVPFVRVDLYEIDNKVYFGEMTFFPAAGFGEFDPPIYNEIIGSWIKI